MRVGSVTPGAPVRRGWTSGGLASRRRVVAARPISRLEARPHSTHVSFGRIAARIAARSRRAVRTGSSAGEAATSTGSSMRATPGCTRPRPATVQPARVDRPARGLVLDLRRARRDRHHRLASRRGAPVLIIEVKSAIGGCRWPRPTGRPLPAARARHRPGSGLVASVRRRVGRRRGWPHRPAPLRRPRDHAQASLPGRWARDGGLDPSAGARRQRPLVLAIRSPDESWAAPASRCLSRHAQFAACACGRARLPILLRHENSGKQRGVQLSPGEGLAERRLDVARPGGAALSPGPAA